MAHHAIWSEVITDAYKTNKSFGSRNNFRQRIHVGTSAINTNLLATLDVVKHTDKHDSDVLIFSLVIDNTLIKELHYNTKTKQVI